MTMTMTMTMTVELVRLVQEHEARLAASPTPPCAI